MLPDFDINNIQEEHAAKDAIAMLLNLIEGIKQENQELKEENQCLKDEINRLKGEQGKPKVKPNKSDDDKPIPANHSSEKERSKQGEKRKKRPKAHRIVINETKVRSVNKLYLPMLSSRAMLTSPYRTSLSNPITSCFERKNIIRHPRKKLMWPTCLRDITENSAPELRH